MPSVDPKPYALTTVEAFFRHLGGAPADPNGLEADRAQQLINAYSRAVIGYTKRQFKPREEGVDKKFAYTGNGYLSLAPFEATAITTVTLYTDLAEDSWLELASQSPTQAASWRANPRNKSEQGTYWSITLPELGRYHPYLEAPWPANNFEFEVTVNADWGVDDEELPDDLELAVWIAVANAWRNPEQFRQRSLGPLSASDYDGFVPGTEEGLSLPRASRALLTRFRRKSTGVR
jgi:hypothetical protein